MPDALSKTLPIWCSVLNRFLFPNQSECHQLYTPPQVVSDSERTQISALLPSFLASLKALNLPRDTFNAPVSKPLRPIWITPDSSLLETNKVYEDFHPVICCTVSRRVLEGEMSGGDYIQGAGDDTENWAHGLTPSIFWSNQEVLLSTPEYDLPEVIKSLLQGSTVALLGESSNMRCLEPTSSLFITNLPAVETKNMNTNAYVIALQPKVTQQSDWVRSKTRLDIGVGPYKLGSRNLRLALPAVVDFAGNIFYEEGRPQRERHIIIACETGKDLSIAVALALLCLFFSDEGQLLTEKRVKSAIDKAFIRRRLGWISTSMPDANPNRASLQSVNSFLM
jgi:tRNA A64-2'-O-ribosylphosphate transferase